MSKSKSDLKKKYREEEDQLDIEDIYDDYDGIVVDGIDKEEEKMLEDIEEDWYGCLDFYLSYSYLHSERKEKKLT